jgi:hypothetical protein
MSEEPLDPRDSAEKSPVIEDRAILVGLRDQSNYPINPYGVVI